MSIFSLQIVVVVSNSWDAQQVNISLFERDSPSSSWAKTLPTFPGCCGKKGMAWGLGLHPKTTNGPVKKEKDLKAPAGIFSFGKVFIDNRFPFSKTLKMPSFYFDENFEAIDDPKSKYYNRIIKTNYILNKDWNSSEKMQMQGDLYHLGLVINHNINPIIPGMGSCIFLHKSRGLHSASAGCTVMGKEQLETLISMLDPLKAPLLVQMPISEYDSKQELWKLPKLS